MPLNPRDMQAAKRAIERHQKLLIVPHANVDPDALSSALACYEVFTGMGKDCTVICSDSIATSLEFLPGMESVTKDLRDEQNFVITLDCSSGVEVDKLRYTVEDHRVNIIVVPKKGKLKRTDVSILEGGSTYDLIVVVDSAELSLLGSVYTDHIDLFTQVPILNIDHHISNTQFGQLQLIDPTAASATEVLYDWFSADQGLKKFLNADLATLLLTGLITDTRSFQNPNTTPRSLEVAAELLDLGARQQEIIQHVYKTKPLSTLKIWGRALNRIQIDSTARIVWSAISREDLLEMGAKSAETHGILDELISTIPVSDVYVLFTEIEDGGLKASLRSTMSVDVNILAQRTYGGGGHARAAGFTVKQYGNFQLQVIECVQRLKQEMESYRAQAEKPRPAMTGRQPTVPTAPTTPKQETPKSSQAKSQVDIVGELMPPSAKPQEKDIVRESGSDSSGAKNSKFQLSDSKQEPNSNDQK